MGRNLKRMDKIKEFQRRQLSYRADSIEDIEQFIKDNIRKVRFLYHNSNKCTDVVAEKEVRMVQHHYEQKIEELEHGDGEWQEIVLLRKKVEELLLENESNALICDGLTKKIEELERTHMPKTDHEEILEREKLNSYSLGKAEGEENSKQDPGLVSGFGEQF